MPELLRPGRGTHRCGYPDINLKIRDGAVWRCETCRRRWTLKVTQLSRSSWRGEWKRRYWPWPR